jgi:hypothetical protein
MLRGVGFIRRLSNLRRVNARTAGSPAISAPGRACGAAGAAPLECRLLAVRPEGANHLWRKNPPRELSIDLVADERLGRVTGRAGAS